MFQLLIGKESTKPLFEKKKKRKKKDKEPAKRVPVVTWPESES